LLVNVTTTSGTREGKKKKKKKKGRLEKICANYRRESEACFLFCLYVRMGMRELHSRSFIHVLKNSAAAFPLPPDLFGCHGD
jgi:hypothetical protein